MISKVKKGSRPSGRKLYRMPSRGEPLKQRCLVARLEVDSRRCSGAIDPLREHRVG